LGVRRLKEFNLALLGKWWWQILHERGTLWYMVLCARYGEEGDGYVVQEGRRDQCGGG
jgi:hypothetical protein